MQLGQQSKLPFFIITEKEQQGYSFGQRLANALAHCFAKGYEKLIVIGNDCPGLSIQAIRKAKQQLVQQKIVIGPTPKGGVYLIGLTAEGFSQTDFENIAWQTNSVFSELKTWAENASAGVCTLPLLTDLNAATDFVTIAKRYGGLYPWLRSLLAQFKCLFLPTCNSKPYISTGPLSAILHRGPPLSLSVVLL